MAFETDPEGRCIAERYAGDDFDKPRIVDIDVLSEWGDNDWSLEEFQLLIAGAVAGIPQEHRATARVVMESPYDGSASLKITYRGPESAATVADRVRRCLEYIVETRTKEAETYRRLKAKFESS